MKKHLIVLFTACMAGLDLLAASNANWVYDSTAKTISDGDWTFNATVSGTSLTVSKPVDASCPSVVTALDFSKPVVDSGDSSKSYTIIEIDTQYHSYNGSKLGSADYVGTLTLPGEGLTTVGDGAFKDCANLDGDLVFPTTLTKIKRCSFANTKITSLDFKAATATIESGASVFQGCNELLWVKFAADGKFTCPNGYLFANCKKLGDADLSGVVSVSVDKNSYAVFYSNQGSSLTNVTLNSSLWMTNKTTNAASYGTVGNALFISWSNPNLATIRFTGPAPDELDWWISNDSGYLGIMSSSQSITTIVPAQYRNTKNSKGKSWADYAASGVLNTSDSTWAAANVKSDVTDLSKRKLILDREPEDDPPTVEDPTVSDIWAYQATVTANGSGIRGGEVFVSLTNAEGAVTGPVTFDDFGKSHTFTGLSCGTEYSVVVVATNAYGSVTNDPYSFTTLAKQAEVSVTKGTDADFNNSQNGSFVISRAEDDATDYALTVAYTVGGTAVAGTDYTALPATATIPVGVRSVTISVVPLFCDTGVAGDTTVSLSLTDDPAYAVVTREATVSVAKIVVKHYSIAAGVGPTGTTRGTFVVSRGENVPIDQKVTLTYTASGTGTDAIYTLSGTVVIPPYATSATIEVFAKNAAGEDVPLTVTIDDGPYTLDIASATITVAAGAASEYWLEDTSANTMSWGGWTFVSKINDRDKTKISCEKATVYPSTVSPLDFSLPVVDETGKQYVLTGVSMRNSENAAKTAVGELMLPGEGLTGFGYQAFSGCTSMTGTLVFPTTCAEIGGESFANCTKVKILGRSLAYVTAFSGKDNLKGVSFEGEVLLLSLEEVLDGGFFNSKVESVRFGSNLKRLVHGNGRDGFLKNCTSLTNVVFDADSRVSLEMGATFEGCTALKEIDLSAVTNITCGRYITTNDKQVVSTNYNNGTFCKCSSLTNVIFGANLQYLASNVFDQAFSSSAASRTITFEGLPPEGFEMPYLSKLLGNGSKGYPTITTYVHRKYLKTENAAGKCWLDYAADGTINHRNSTWASGCLPAEITDLTRRPLLTIEPPGLIFIVR